MTADPMTESADRERAPTEADFHRAAQIWCEPQHAHKTMDAELAKSIAAAFATIRAESEAAGAAREREACAKVADEYAELFRNREKRMDVLGKNFTMAAMGAATIACINFAERIRARKSP